MDSTRLPDQINLAFQFVALGDFHFTIGGIRTPEVKLYRAMSDLDIDDTFRTASFTSFVPFYSVEELTHKFHTYRLMRWEHLAPVV